LSSSYFALDPSMDPNNPDQAAYIPALGTGDAGSFDPAAIGATLQDPGSLVPDQINILDPVYGPPAVYGTDPLTGDVTINGQIDQALVNPAVPVQGGPAAPAPGNPASPSIWSTILGFASVSTAVVNATVARGSATNTTAQQTAAATAASNTAKPSLLSQLFGPKVPGATGTGTSTIVLFAAIFVGVVLFLEFNE
jgi:hypothetical protein